MRRFRGEDGGDFKEQVEQMVEKKMECVEVYFYQGCLE